MKQTCQSCQTKYEPSEFVLYDSPARCPACRVASAKRYATLGWMDGHFARVDIVSGIPARFQTLNASDAVTSAEKLADVAMKRHAPLFLSGKAQSGKTLALVVLAKRLIRCGVPVAFVNVAQFSAWLRQNQDSVAPQVQRLSTVRHLFLDDLGAEHDKTGWWQSILYTVADTRYINKRPISASTNTPDKVESRVYRRLTEFAFCAELTCK